MVSSLYKGLLNEGQVRGHVTKQMLYSTLAMEAMGQTHHLSHLLTPPQKLTLRTKVSLPWDVPMKYMGMGGRWERKRGESGKSISCRTLALLSTIPWVTTVPKQWLFPPSAGKEIGVTENLGVTPVTAPVVLWPGQPVHCGLRNACCHPQHCPRPCRNCWAGILYKLLCLLAPPEEQEGHSSAVVYEQSLSPLLSSTFSCSSHRGKQWNEGKSGGDLGLMRLFRGGQGLKHKNRKPIPFPSNWESQTVHKLLSQVTEQKVELEAHSSCFFCI